MWAGKFVVGLVLFSAATVVVQMWSLVESFGPQKYLTIQNALSLGSWLLVVAGIAGTILAGHGIRWGWLVLFSVQPFRVIYAVATDQHGFILGAIAYGAAQLNGYVRSRASRPLAVSKSLRRP